MRWFTDAAYDDEEEGAWERMCGDYLAHVRQIAPLVSPDLARLALEPELNLHDARFERVEVDPDNRTVTIIVVTGHLQVGYRRLTMAFTGASIVPENLQLLGFAIRAEFRPAPRSRDLTFTEILAHEVDVAPGGRAVLRLRLWPFHEFGVEFDGFSLTEEPVAERGPARPGAFVLHRRKASSA
jgi:hypothetical protein